MRTDEKDCSMLCDKLSTGVLNERNWVIYAERTNAEDWRKTELRMESNLPVFYKGSFRSLIMHHPRYELKDEYLNDFSCKFCFLNKNGEASPYCAQDLIRKKIPLFIGMVGDKNFLFKHGKSLYESDGFGFKKCHLLRRMTVSENKRNISYATTIKNKAYSGFVLLQASNKEDKHGTASCVSIVIFQGSQHNCWVMEAGCAHILRNTAGSNVFKPLVIFFNVPKPFTEKDEDFQLPEEEANISLCLAWGGDCDKPKGISVDTSEEWYPSIFFSEESK